MGQSVWWNVPELVSIIVLKPAPMGTRMHSVTKKVMHSMQLPA